MNNQEDLIIYSNVSGVFSLEVDGFKSKTFYFKSKTNNIIVEFKDIITRLSGKTFISAMYNIVNADEKHSGEIELYHRDKLIRVIPYQYIPTEQNKVSDTDLFDIVPDEIVLKPEEDTYILSSITDSDLASKVRVLCSSDWCSVKIEDNQILINVEENLFRLDRKTKIKFFIDVNGKHKSDYTLLKQKGRQ